MANIKNIKPAYFLGSLLTNPKVLGGKVAEMITALTEKSTVTQATSISTGVTINSQSGVITTVSLSTAADTDCGSFTVTNNKCYSNSVVLLTVVNSGTGAPIATVTSVSNGSFVVKLRNVHSATALNSVLKLNYQII
jgi:hypothetical protein